MKYPKNSELAKIWYEKGRVEAIKEFKAFVKEGEKETGANKCKDNDEWGEGYDDGVNDLCEIILNKIEDFMKAPQEKKK
jgi:hypothetical protein